MSVRGGSRIRSADSRDNRTSRVPVQYCICAIRVSCCGFYGREGQQNTVYQRDRPRFHRRIIHQTIVQRASSPIVNMSYIVTSSLFEFSLPNALFLALAGIIAATCLRKTLSPSFKRSVGPIHSSGPCHLAPSAGRDFAKALEASVRIRSTT